MDGELSCGTVEAFCVCELAPHDAAVPHECACGGAWKISNGRFEVVSWPEAPPAFPSLGLLDWVRAGWDPFSWVGLPNQESADDGR